MPLSYWPPWVSQHIWPMTMFSPSAVTSQQHLPDGVILPNFIVVQHSDCYLHLLSITMHTKKSEWFSVRRHKCMFVCGCKSADVPLSVHMALRSWKTRCSKGSKCSSLSLFSFSWAFSHSALSGSSHRGLIKSTTDQKHSTNLVASDSSLHINTDWRCMLFLRP